MIDDEAARSAQPPGHPRSDGATPTMEHRPDGTPDIAAPALAPAPASAAVAAAAGLASTRRTGWGVVVDRP